MKVINYQADKKPKLLMSKNVINEINAFLWICIFIFLLPCKVVADVFPEVYPLKDTINSFNQISPNRIKHCFEEGNILDYLYLRRELYGFTFDKLSQLKEYLNKKPAYRALANLVNEIYIEKSNIYTFKEEFLLNNVPSDKYLPFYKDEDRVIEKIAQSAERLYFNNLKLFYKSNSLRNINDNLFVNSRLALKIDNFFKMIRKTGDLPKPKPADYVLQKVVGEWGYKLKADNNYNRSHERALVKLYCENIIQPILLKNIVLLRNAYRLFALDLYSGKQIWSVSPDTSDEEFYETAIHLHHIPYGYGMLFDKGIVYAELAGMLVAYDINIQIKPVLKWKNDLGEYTLATVPVIMKDILVASLINARGELWVSGFSESNGALKWSTYIGLSSFAAPVCVVPAEKTDNKLFLATNHGILICINASDGQLVWVRKYEPNEYSVFKWFFEKQFLRKNLEHEGFIEFDSQFIVLDEAANTLAYKPRESEVLYLLNPKTGELLDEIRNDLKRYTIISMLGSGLIMLDKQDKDSIQFLVIRYPDGQVLYRKKLGSGKLLGIAYKNKKELAFKVGNTVYAVDYNDAGVKLSEIDSKERGWLIGYKKDFIFLGEKNNVRCLDIVKKRQYFYNQHNQFLENQQKLLLEINAILDGNIGTDVSNKGHMDKRIDFLFDSLKVAHIQAQQIVPAIIRNLGKLKSNSQRAFFSKLGNLYGNEIIEYKEVSLKFDGFLRGLGLLESIFKKENVQLPGATALKNKIFASDNVSLLPIKVISGTEPDFFILSHNDMVYCVDESGGILWSRKVAYREQAHDAKRIDVYLYNGIIIINDKINVVAVNNRTGGYLWSVTDKGVYDKNIFVKEGDKIEYKLEFLGNKIFLVHENKISIIDSLTGFCSRESILAVDNIDKIFIFDEKIILITRKIVVFKKLFSNTVKKENRYAICMLNNNLATLNYVNLGKRIGSYKYFDLCLFKKNIVMLSPFQVSVYDSAIGKISKFYNFNNSPEAYLIKNSDNLILIKPFKSLVGFKLKGVSLTAKWSFDFESENVKSTLNENLKTSFTIDGTNVMAFIKKGSDYSLISINTDSGTKAWECSLSSIGGKFGDIYNIHCVDNFIYILMSSAFKHSDSALQNQYRGEEVLAFNVYPVLIKINKITGELEYIKEFPHIVSFGYKRGAIVHTKNYVLVTVNGGCIFTERR